MHTNETTEAWLRHCRLAELRRAMVADARQRRHGGAHGGAQASKPATSPTLPHAAPTPALAAHSREDS
jgi:hypothetical protein